MQRTGNALGIAVLQIPFFAALRHALASGIPVSLAYTRAFSSVTAAAAAVMLVVLVLLIFFPPQHGDR